MKCPLCKGNMTKGKTNLPYDLNEESVVVIKSVPALICDQCGESFVEMAVSKAVEKIISSAKRDGLTLGFIDYQAAA